MDWYDKNGKISRKAVVQVCQKIGRENTTEEAHAFGLQKNCSPFSIVGKDCCSNQRKHAIPFRCDFHVYQQKNQLCHQ